MSKEGIPSAEVKSTSSQESQEWANKTAQKIENDINKDQDASPELAREAMKVGDTLGTKAQTENIDIKPAKEDKKSPGFSDKVKNIWKSIDSLFDRKPISKMDNPAKILQMAKDDAYELTTTSSTNTGVGGASLGGGINWGSYGERYNLSNEAKIAEEKWNALNKQKLEETDNDKRVELQRQQNAVRLGFGSQMIKAAEKRAEELTKAKLEEAA